MGDMLKKLLRLLPHVAMLICNMYVVFFLIDRVNPAMNFIDNGLTKGLLLILCAVALYNAWTLFRPAPARRVRAPQRRPASANGYRPAQRSGMDRRPVGYGSASYARRSPAYDRRDASRGYGREGMRR